VKVAAVIPAYNEDKRLGGVLETVLQVPCVHEVIVVSDGSKDNTYQVACSFDGVRAFQLEVNAGKGGALYEGVRQTDAEIIVFLDADLEGLKPVHVEKLVKPVAECGADMCIGVFRGGRWFTTLSQIISPNISGQRAIKRELFLKVPHVVESRFGIEVKINKFFRRKGYTVKRVVLHGVTHTVKEAKIGKIKGSFARMRMYAEILKVYFFNSHGN
jgi:glycosyltransferase involved in cell wall biosynthesis